MSRHPRTTPSTRPPMQRATRVTFYFLLLTLLVSCSSPTPAAPYFPTFILITQDPNASPTLTPFQPSDQVNTPLPTFTQAPLESATLTVTLTPSPTQTFTPPPPTPIVDPVTTSVPPPVNPSRTNYIMYATLDFDAHTLDVDETIRYYNNTGVTLSDIVLSVQPNFYNGAF